METKENDETKFYFNELKDYKSDGMVVASNSNYSNTRSPNISVRDDFSRSDYDYFRQNEEIPVRPKEIMTACMQAYKRFAIIRTVIDMMSDFVCKGIDVVHPNASQQKFGKEWFSKVGGPERSERMASMLLRTGAAPVKRNTKKISDALMTTFRAESSIKSPVNLSKGEVPIEYIIMDPRLLEIIGGEFTPLVRKNNIKYQVVIPERLSKLSDNQSDYDLLDLGDKIYINSLTLIGSKIKTIPIDPKYLEVLHYKKDDFQLWATPIIYPLIDDLKMLDKLKLADRAALDGVISNVRLWNIGSLEHKIFPGPAAIEKLASMLMNNVGGGSLDLIWGPELSFKESSTTAHQFLGNAKFIPTLSNIYQGMGIPPTLTGIVGESSGGFSNNAVSLKVMVERLDYLRGVIKAFWEKELKIIQSIFGFSKPFSITFDSPNLFEDSAIQKILLELVDRNIISDEFIQDRIGAIPEIEQVRISRENKLKDKGKMPEKLSPQLPNPTSEKTGNQNGRPNGSKDSSKRKTKKISPVNLKADNRLDIMAWAENAQSKINDFVTEPFLKMNKKKNLRSLSAKEFDNFENLKFTILCSIKPFTNIDESLIKNTLSNLKKIPDVISKECKSKINKRQKDGAEELSISEVRQIQSIVYASFVDSIFPA